VRKLGGKNKLVSKRFYKAPPIRGNLHYVCLTLWLAITGYNLLVKLLPTKPIMTESMTLSPLWSLSFDSICLISCKTLCSSTVLVCSSTNDMNFTLHFFSTYSTLWISFIASYHILNCLLRLVSSSSNCSNLR
jgi:hypothetical protein